MEGQKPIVFDSENINQTQAHTEQKYFVETAEDPKKKKAKERRLLVIIASVIVILVATIVIVLVVNNTDQTAKSETPVEEELTEFEQQKKRYEQLIAMAEDAHEAAVMKVEYSFLLIDNELYQEAFDLLETIMLTDFETALEQKEYYAAYRDYYWEIGDGENWERFNDLIGEVLQDTEYGMGG